MKRKLGMFFMEAGTVLIILALFLFLYDRWEADRAQKAAEETVAILEGTIDDNTEEEETLEIEGEEYIGILTISRYGLELPVMSEWSYAGLKVSPGRYCGDVSEDNLVICGHNYERHFGNLKNLEAGDEIIFTDLNADVYTYQVEEVIILEPADVEGMVSQETKDWDLTLFTCTVGGQARVTVRCTRVENKG